MQKMKSITDSKYEDHIQIYTIADRELSESPTTSRAAPPSSDHVDRDNVDHIPSCSTELRPPDHIANNDRREERRYDNRDHRENKPKSSRTGRLHHHRSDFYQR